MSVSESPRIFPTLRFRDAAMMIGWLQEAFGFTIHNRYDTETGEVAHAELAFGSSMIMCGQSRPDEYGKVVGDAGMQGGKSIYIAVDDPDMLLERARKAGATIVEELTDRDYGSREFICTDPEGNVWCFGTYWPKLGD